MELKDVVGYEGRYKISETGTLYSVITSRRVPCEPRERKTSVHKTGYEYAVLSNGTRASMHAAVHRLVADAFIPNPNNHPQVDHIDGNRLNNDVNNLQWLTHQANCEKANAKVYYLQHRDGSGVFVNNLTKWCKVKGLNYSKLFQMSTGKRHSSGGYTHMERVDG